MRVAAAERGEARGGEARVALEELRRRDQAGAEQRAAALDDARKLGEQEPREVGPLAAHTAGAAALCVAVGLSVGD